MSSHQVYRVFKEDSGISARFTEEKRPEIDQGEVLIRVRYSSINYKDALGVTGRGKIYKKFPIVGGIDAAGVVGESRSEGLKEGDEVLVTGCGLGEIQDGGYGEYVKVPASWVIPLPAGLTLKESMILGTAGFTAALCVHRMEQNDQKPAQGPVLVTGASGGVGSLSVNILAARGYEVEACTSRDQHKDFLKKLGAVSFVTPGDLSGRKKPLEKGVWAGAVDNIGGEVLAGIVSSVKLWGNVASVGLVLDHNLNTTVMPFILRGVSLLGISSANCPRDIRVRLWERLSSDMKPAALHTILEKEISFQDLPEAFDPYMNRGVTGRRIVVFS